MKIGIDAKWFYDGPPSGKVVVRNLLENLIRVNEDNELFIFLNMKHRQEIFPFVDSKIHLVYIWGGINLLSNIFVLNRKAKILKLDAVLFQNFSAITKKFHSIAFIHDILFLSHPHFFGFKEKLYFFPMKYLSKKSKLIITISNSEKNRLVKYNFSSPENIKVVYHGVDKIFRPKNEIDPNILLTIQNKYNLPEEFILYVGRLNIRKNIKNLLLAFKEIQNKEIPIVIVGKSDHKMFDIDSFITKNALSNRIILLGFVPDEDLPILYASASMFCYLSFAEGFGLPILEAMASGTPVLTSNTTSMPEIASDAAVLVSPSSVKEIENGINLLLQDKQYSNQITEGGLNRAKYFSWEKSAKMILKHITDIKTD